jgi:acyl-CoA dehydrogenase
LTKKNILLFFKQDTPLAEFWVQARTIRFADGPDEVHLQQVGRIELRRAAGVKKLAEEQERKSQALLSKAGKSKL